MVHSYPTILSYYYAQRVVDAYNCIESPCDEWAVWVTGHPVIGRAMDDRMDSTGNRNAESTIGDRSRVGRGFRPPHPFSPLFIRPQRPGLGIRTTLISCTRCVYFGIFDVGLLNDLEPPEFPRSPIMDLNRC